MAKTNVFHGIFKAKFPEILNVGLLHELFTVGCPEGEYLDGSTCTGCPQGTYKTGYGDEIDLCVNCSTELPYSTTVNTSSTVKSECSK